MFTHLPACTWQHLGVVVIAAVAAVAAIAAAVVVVVIAVVVIDRWKGREENEERWDRL